jgi:DNA replication protein DnaC
MCNSNNTLYRCCGLRACSATRCELTSVPHLLPLDELGYLPIDKRGADLLIQVVADRYESGSIVLTTNRPFRECGALFESDNTLAAALIDRLMHYGEAIIIQGDSYRMRDKVPDPPSA